MIVDLKVSAASAVVTMANCPKAYEAACGVLYRMP